jgi:serine protease Do
METVVGELPADEDLKLSEGGIPKPKDVNRVGVVVMDLTKEQREKLEIKKGGVLVDKIEPDSPAMRAGMRRGDVVMKINGEDVKDAKQFESVVKALPEKKNVAVLVQRSSGSVFLALKIEDQPAPSTDQPKSEKPPKP